MSPSSKLTQQSLDTLHLTPSIAETLMEEDFNCAMAVGTVISHLRPEKLNLVWAAATFGNRNRKSTIRAFTSFPFWIKKQIEADAFWIDRALQSIDGMDSRLGVEQ